MLITIISFQFGCLQAYRKEHVTTKNSFQVFCRSLPAITQVAGIALLVVCISTHIIFTLLAVLFYLGRFILHENTHPVSNYFLFTLIVIRIGNT